MLTTTMKLKVKTTSRPQNLCCKRFAPYELWSSLNKDVYNSSKACPATLGMDTSLMDLFSQTNQILNENIFSLLAFFLQNQAWCYPSNTPIQMEKRPGLANLVSWLFKVNDLFFKL